MAEDVGKILKKYNEEIEEKFKRHTGVFLEEFQSQVKTVAEGFETLSDKIDRMEITMDRMGTTVDKLSDDMEIVKTDTEFIKNGLKRKVDFEEFEALERRVAMLEARAK